MIVIDADDFLLLRCLLFPELVLLVGAVLHPMAGCPTVFAFNKGTIGNVVSENVAF